MEKSKADEDREKLQQYLLTIPDDQQAQGWDDMWQKKVTPWDRSRPNPALEETLVEKRHLTESPSKQDANGSKVRKRVLVPGCGRGYDVLLFASYGFDAYGLDASQTAIDAANELLQQQSEKQSFPVQREENGRGDVKFIAADFFKDGSLPGADSISPGSFDLIYDYTFLCALPPSMRPRWAARISELLAPDGTLICLEFPLGKDPKLGGPPHGLEAEVYQQLFQKPGQEVQYDSTGHIVADESDGKTESSLVRIDTWKPKQMFEGQEKSTMVSLWKHWKQ